MFLEIEIAGYLPREDQRRRKEQQYCVQDQQHELEVRPVLQAAPPKHAPPYGHDIDQDIYRPQSLDPTCFDRFAEVNGLAQAGQDVRYAQAHDDWQDYAEIFEYAHSRSFVTRICPDFGQLRRVRPVRF